MRFSTRDTDTEITKFLKKKTQIKYGCFFKRIMHIYVDIYIYTLYTYV